MYDLSCSLYDILSLIFIFMVRRKGIEVDDEYNVV